MGMLAIIFITLDVEDFRYKPVTHLIQWKMIKPEYCGLFHLIEHTH